MKKLLCALFFWVSPAGATTYFNDPPYVFIQGSPGDTCVSNPTACAKSAEVNADFNQLRTDGNAAYATLKAQLDAITGSGAPAKAVIAVDSAECPPGYIVANGTAGSPDARGVFIRGLGAGSSIDSARVLNTYQDDMFQTHGHADQQVVLSLTGSSQYAAGDFSLIDGLSGASSHTDTTNTSATETRPNAVVLLYCYKS